MVAGTLVMDITKGALNQIRSGARGGQIQQLEAGMDQQEHSNRKFRF
jgi:hypothetical protein